MTISRRTLLKVAAIGGAAAALPMERSAFTSSTSDRLPTSKLPKRFSLPLTRPSVLAPGRGLMAGFDGQVREYDRYDLVQAFGVAEILPGYKTPVFGYNGSVPGPTLQVDQGSPVIIRQTNLLHLPPAPPHSSAAMPAPYTSDPLKRSTSTHLHGSASLPQFDGYASDLTFPTQTKSYLYPNAQNARTLWYHDHGAHHTAHNVYSGLVGMCVRHDPEERALGIPAGDYDVPLIVGDAMFDTNGGFIFDDNSNSGLFGDVILVNGGPWPVMAVEPRKYRFRILNASVSRSYTWQLHDGRSQVAMTMIGTDAGLAPQPREVGRFRHGPGERYEIVVDFAPYAQKAGSAPARLTLKNLSARNNIDYEGTTQAMQFVVGPTSTIGSSENNDIPADWQQRVRPHECMTWSESSLRAQGVRERRFDLIRKNSRWTINGETWQDVIDSGFQRCQATPGRGDVEIWEIRNPSGGWFHPVHIHLVDFQILSRNGSAANVQPHEKGPKDVVYVGENETVRVAARFGGASAGEGWPEPEGRYMVHCHNLVHEDHDMMMQFRVGDKDSAPEFDPIIAAPASASG